MKVLVALVLGGAAYLLTDQVVVAVLVAAAGFWLTRSRAKGASGRPPRPTPVPPRTERSTGTEVVCKQVTPHRQEWVSLKTGRLYDVLSQNGPPDARPGDHGRVVVSGSSYRIRPSPRSESEV